MKGSDVIESFMEFYTRFLYPGAGELKTRRDRSYVADYPSRTSKTARFCEDAPMDEDSTATSAHYTAVPLPQ